MSSASDHDVLVGMGFPADKVLLAHPGDLDEPAEGETLGGEPSGKPAEASSSKEDDGEIQDGEQTAQSLMCDECQKLFRDASAAERHATKTGHVQFSESTTAIKPLTEEEKAEKLAELKQRLAEKRELRLLQEKEEEKNREKIRRKTGKELTDAREKLEEREMQKALLAKKKEKEEERLAKAKIKEQIEADKKERAAKREAAKQANLQHRQEEEAAEAARVAQASKEYTEARLQIRRPDGQPITHTFQSTDTLQVVYDHVTPHIIGPFQLATTFPRRIFGNSEMGKTLKELGLVPSAVLVAIS
ncbi:8911_t:CDS:2 [Acaulospora morrowiae]|uniref:8911_t:CDS:1 n=1 Tax=Acaulospora morrowiae TaxID=94023 RepID=A0A9N9EVS4_9GLOM|nr:8911_t:CDS:2 [Acaulospora morrowiae]